MRANKARSLLCLIVINAPDRSELSAQFRNKIKTNKYGAVRYSAHSQRCLHTDTQTPLSDALSLLVFCDPLILAPLPAPVLFVQAHQNSRSCTLENCEAGPLPTYGTHLKLCARFSFRHATYRLGILTGKIFFTLVHFLHSFLVSLSIVFDESLGCPEFLTRPL